MSVTTPNQGTICVEKRKFYLLQVYLVLSMGVISFKYQQDLWHQKTRVTVWDIMRHYLHVSTISYFDTILAYDERMDRQTDVR